MFRPKSIILLFAFIVSGCASAVRADVNSIEVFVSGTEGYHTFRIPSVIVTPAGHLLATCEGRKSSRSDHGDVDLVMKRSEDGGATWSPLQLIYEEGGHEPITIGNPCPVVDSASNTIWMPFCRDNDRVFVTRSIDDGRTWSNPVEVTQSVKPSSWTWYATGPGVGIQLKHGEHAGRLVIPCDHGTEQNGQRTMTSHVFYSDDHGMTWQLGGSLDRHTDECQLVELSDATLLINCRNYWERDGGRPDRGRMRAVAHSHDGGQTWSELRFDETLIEPMCQASLVSNPENHDQLLFSNPASTDSRDHLTVRLSRDAGKSWPVSLLLHEGPAAYSSLAVLPNGLAACLYEAGQQSAYEAIRFAPFRVEWLAK